MLNGLNLILKKLTEKSNGRNEFLKMKRLDFSHFEYRIFEYSNKESILTENIRVKYEPTSPQSFSPRQPQHQRINA